MRHREYECYIKKGSKNRQPGEKHRQQNQNNFGIQGNQLTGGGHHSNNGKIFQRQFHGGRFKQKEIGSKVWEYKELETQGEE